MAKRERMSDCERFWCFDRLGSKTLTRWKVGRNGVEGMISVAGINIKGRFILGGAFEARSSI